MENLLWKEKLSYGIGAYGKDFVYNMITAFLMIFYTDEVGVSLIFVSTLFLVVRIIDALSNPFMGWLVDNTKTKWGKFRPWILGGTVVNAVCLIFVYLNPALFLSRILINIWCVVTYFLWSITYTLMDVPFWAMIPSFSADIKVRNEISMLSRLFANFGAQMMSAAGLIIIVYLSSTVGSNKSDGFFYFAVMVAVIFVVCEVICVKNVREYLVVANEKKRKLTEIVNFLKLNDQLLIILLMTVLQQIAVFLWIGMNIYFFKYVVCQEEWFSIFGIVNFVLGSAALLVFPYLANKFSRKVVYILSSVFLVLGLLGMFFTGSDENANIWLFFSMVGFFCLGNALAGVTTTVMLADTVEYGEYKSGIRSEAVVFSVQTFTVKFGSAIAGFIGAMVLSLVGYVPNAVQTPETVLGLRVMMFIMSALLIMVILCLYLKFYKLNGSFYFNILKELSKRREKISLD